MTIQQITVFLAVCEELNYTRAAYKVFILFLDRKL